MAENTITYSKNWGYTDPTTASVAVYPLDIANFAVKADEPTECVLINTATPVDQPESIRYAIQNVTDMYAGSDVDPVNKAASKRGKSVVVGVRDILRVTNDATGEFVDLPVKTNISFSFPISAQVSASEMQHCVKRAVGLVLEASGTARINELMRGSLKPTE